MKRATSCPIVSIFGSNISIHALVKRATYIYFVDTSVNNNFNPRPREEGDVSLTVHKGVKIYFNPRPREEGDTIWALAVVTTEIFQSTPS